MNKIIWPAILLTAVATAWSGDKPPAEGAVSDWCQLHEILYQQQKDMVQMLGRLDEVQRLLIKAEDGLSDSAKNLDERVSALEKKEPALPPILGPAAYIHPNDRMRRRLARIEALLKKVCP